MSEPRDYQRDVAEMRKRFVAQLPEIKNPHPGTVTSIQKIKQQSRGNPAPALNPYK